MKEMTTEELDAFYRNLAELTEKGSEEKVRGYITEHYDRLPEKVQNEILGNALLTAIQDEVREEKAVGEMFDEGLAAAEVLEKAKQEIQQEGLTK